jgi:hypothetical protein
MNFELGRGGIYYGENYITFGGMRVGRSFEGNVGRPVRELWNLTWNCCNNTAFSLGPR